MATVQTSKNGIASTSNASATWQVHTPFWQPWEMRLVDWLCCPVNPFSLFVPNVWRVSIRMCTKFAFPSVYRSTNGTINSKRRFVFFTRFRLISLLPPRLMVARLLWIHTSILDQLNVQTSHFKFTLISWNSFNSFAESSFFSGNSRQRRNQRQTQPEKNFFSKRGI